MTQVSFLAHLSITTPSTIRRVVHHLNSECPIIKRIAGNIRRTMKELEAYIRTDVRPGFALSTLAKWNRQNRRALDALIEADYCHMSSQPCEHCKAFGETGYFQRSTDVIDEIIAEEKAKIAANVTADVNAVIKASHDAYINIGGSL